MDTPTQEPGAPNVVEPRAGSPTPTAVQTPAAMPAAAPTPTPTPAATPAPATTVFDTIRVMDEAMKQAAFGLQDVQHSYTSSPRRPLSPPSPIAPRQMPKSS